MTVLPSDGQQNWGDPLNAYILALQTLETNTQASLSNHASNTPADPHGDRAYAQSLVSPITSGTNQANGYVKLNSQGLLPLSFYGPNGGMFNKVWDVVEDFGATPSTSVDSSTAIQNALNTANANGGGIVWVPDSTFSLANYLIMPANVWLLMSPGTILQRIQGSTIPPYLISNIQFTSGTSPSSRWFITGGKLDAVGSQNLSQACIPLYIFQSNNSVVRDLAVNNVFNNPAITVNGSIATVIDSCVFSGTGSSGSSPSAATIDVEKSSSLATPSGLSGGLYNNQLTDGLVVSNCTVSHNGNTFPPYGGFLGTSLSSPTAANNVRVLGNVTHDTNFVGNGPVNYGAFANYNDAGNLWATFQIGSNTSSNWRQMSVIGSWNNSMNGPALQVRWAQNIPNSFEIIGDLTVGNTADGTIIGNLPTGFAPASTQEIPVVLPSGTASINARISVNNSGQLQSYGFSGDGGNRVAFHSFISIDA